MELWAGLMGVEEHRQNYALTPIVGWFVRKSHELRKEGDPEFIFIAVR